MYIKDSCNSICLRHMVCFGCVIVNAVHQGGGGGDDDDDDDDDNNNNNLKVG